MAEFNDDHKEYVRIWTAILRHLLLYSEEEIENWMHHQGFALLLSADSFVLHEEPWFWLCSTVLFGLSPGREGADLRAQENKIFWVLDHAIRGNDLAHVDWEVVRRQCLAALSE